MSGRLGCVLAIRNRPAEVLERTLQTYTFQTLAPADRLLLDYGSEPAATELYRDLCRKYGWRLVTYLPDPPRWWLSDAYNRAVHFLGDQVETVFKSDVDILLGQDVLEMAAVLGRDKLCLFSYLTTQEGAAYPDRLTKHGDLIGLLADKQPPTDMPGEGVQAFPRRWFTEVGGYDLVFEGWGFEDSDLRERAKMSIGLTTVSTSLLIHQWHPRGVRPEEAAKNRAYYDRMKRHPQLVRNGGTLTRDKRDKQESSKATRQEPHAAVKVTKARPSQRVAVVTRSMNEQLYQVSGEFLALDRLTATSPYHFERHRLTGTDSLHYFRELLRLDADWVVNLDEDAFVLHPERLVELIQHMDEHHLAACGMPDGGVVAIRQHNPVACNAFFNVFDLRRVRPVWQDWDSVLKAKHQPAFESQAPAWARKTPAAFDHYERYYGVFFSLLAAGEKILYLDAEEWQDGVSTLLKDHGGEPLLVHCWYTRYWDTSYHTRRRYQVVIDYARQVQGQAPPSRPEEARTPVEAPRAESNEGKWDDLYKDREDRQPYGDTQTYEKAAKFLGGLSTVEDWGCGWAWFKDYLPSSVTYRGLDGSKSPFADAVVDLTRYTSRVEGILLRHVLEHNPAWEDILTNALRSFTKRLALVLFTPFSERTGVINYNESLRVPDIAFAKEDLTRLFAGLHWELEEGLATKTQYGVEHLFYVEKP